jgi:hypothetical protein
MIDGMSTLRALYPAPSERARRKQLDALGDIVETGVDAPAESQAQMMARYAADL